MKLLKSLSECPLVMLPPAVKAGITVRGFRRRPIPIVVGIEEKGNGFAGMYTEETKAKHISQK